MSKIALLTAAVMVLGGIVATPATAAPASTSTWTGNGDGDWEDPQNWDVLPGPGSDLVFPDSGAVTNRYTYNSFPPGSQFGAVRVEGNGYILAGNSFGASALDVEHEGGVITVSAGLDLTAQGTLDLTVQSGATAYVSGVVSGPNGLTKKGAGTLTLRGNNTYAGVTQITAGTLAIAHSAALGSSDPAADTKVSDGATLELRGTINTAERVAITGNGVNEVGALNNGEGNNVIQHLTLATNATIGAAADTFLLIAEDMRGGVDPMLTKVGQGTVDLLRKTPNLAATSVRAGTLAVEGTVSGGIVTIQNGAHLALAGGTVGGVLCVGGTVTAGFGASPFISRASTVHLWDGSTYRVQLNGTGPGNGSTGHSRVDVEQSFNLAGKVTLAAGMASYTPDVGDEIVIVTTTAGVTGTFNGLPEGAYFTVPGGPGRTFQISYVGGDGNDISLTAVADTTTTLTATPNPAEKNQAIELNATVTPATASGTVTFKNGATTLGTASVTGGTATLELRNLATGSHALTASYNGSGTAAASTSTPLTQKVEDPAPETTITGGPENASRQNPTRAEISFTSPDKDVAEYQCSLDGGLTYWGCTSPEQVTNLRAGENRFLVRAVDDAGNRDATPAELNWHVNGDLTLSGSMHIDGDAKVGQTLRVVSDVSAWPAATTVTGQWLRGTTPVPGATGLTYLVTNSDAGSTLRYVETLERADHNSREASTVPTGRVTGGIITLDAPTISGDALVSEVLTATAGPVDPVDAQVTLSWNVDGRPTGATGSTYTLLAADAGKSVTVTAHATRDDYDPVVETSAPTAPVANAQFAAGPAATIDGVFKVGEELTAHEGAPSPAADSYSYQWFAAGDKLAGATGRTFTLGKEHKGLAISVAVTATRAGYVDATSTSAASPQVVTNTAPDLSLTQTATRIREGQSTMLSWTSGDALTVNASGQWSGTKPASGSQTVTPTGTGAKTYTLTATNGSGTTTAQVTTDVTLAETKLKVSARKVVKAGRKVTISAKGLAPHEAYTVRIGGVKVASGKATAAGTVKRQVKVASSTKAGKRTVRVTGSFGDRTGTRHIKVTKAKVTVKKLVVKVRTTSVRASDSQKVTVRNLRPHEKVKVTYQGKRITSKNARANAKGVYTKTFKVGTAWGRKAVTLKGMDSRRTVTKKFTVTNRCPQGGYYCR